MARDPIQQIEREQEEIDERDLQYKNFTIEQYYAMQGAIGPLGKCARLEYYSGVIVDADADRCTFFTIHQYHAMLEVGDAPILEFWNGLILDMSGGTEEHILIAKNIVKALVKALDGGPCDAFPEGAAVDTSALETFHFPDCTVVCGNSIFKPAGKTKQGVLTNPVLIVEVISEISRRYDSVDKFEAYKALPTFSEYLLVEQEKRLITHWQKVAGEWVSETITDGVIRLTSVDRELEMVRIYDGVGCKGSAFFGELGRFTRFGPEECERPRS